MSQTKLKYAKTCVTVVLVLVVICQRVGAIKSNYSIGFENVHYRVSGYNNSHSGHGSGHKNVFTTTPAPRARPTYPTNIHMKPNRTLSTSSDFGHSNRNHSKHNATVVHRSTTLRPPVKPTNKTTSSDFGHSNRNHSKHNTTVVHRSSTLRPPVKPTNKTTSSDFGHSNRNHSKHNATVVHGSTTLRPPVKPTNKTRTTPKPTPLTTLPPILPPRQQKPITPLNFHPRNGTQPKIIYLNQKPHKSNSDWDDFNLFVEFLRNISSNANKHKKRTKVINGQKIHYYYVTRDYYHNSHSVPKVMEVKMELLKPCAGDATKVWCVPNTYSMCSTSGPTMCIAYMNETVPCANDTCVVTKYPCDRNGRNPACTHHYDLFTYIPCVSHVKLLPTPSDDFFTQMTATVIDLCAVSIIEAMPLESPVASITNLFVELGKSHMTTIKNYNITHK